MAEDKQKNSAFSRRRVLWRVLTVFMFFYLCADVSVLEYFCGNPSLGTASYRQVIEINRQPVKTSETIVVRNSIDAAPSSKHDEDTDIPIDGDDCFCCSSHATVSYSYLVVLLLPVISPQQRDPDFSSPQNHSDGHLPPSYRPPRIA
ncbi:MAG: hypothetical protein ACR2L1_01800 [Pyrinomonadaceae bacterium]